MKNFKKILVAVLSIIMVISMVACTGDPQETPAPESSKPEASTPEASTPEASNPEASNPGSSETDPTPPSSSETDPIVPEVDINDSMKGFVIGEGDILDGKPTADNGYSGTMPWTGAAVDNYVIMSGNAAENSTTSAIRVHFNVTADALVSFSVKVDSAEGDVFYVLLDNAKYGKGDYVAGTYIVKMIVAAGEHTISLVYQKDGSGAAGADAAYVSKFTVVKSDVSALPTELGMTLDKPAGFDWDKATTLEVEDNVTVMNGGSKSNIGSRNFIYLKKTHDYPRADMPFTVSEDGAYEFIITICAKKRNPGILSTGLVQIDEGPMYLLSSEHGDRNEVLEYFAGISEYLTKGEHVMHFYLTDDFDDSSVKSIYFDQVSFAKVPAVIDGVKGENEYTDATEYVIGDAWGDNSKLTDYTSTGAKAWVTNSKAGLYIYAEVDDKTPFGDTNNDGDDGDKFQAYVDFVRDYRTSGLTAGDYKKTGTAGSQRLGWVNVTPDGNIWGGWGFSGVDGLASKVVITETGYTLEMFIPWNVETLPEDGMIGLSLCFHDDINDDQKRDAIFFTTGGTDYWNSYEALPTYTIK